MGKCGMRLIFQAGLFAATWACGRATGPAVVDGGGGVDPVEASVAPSDSAYDVVTLSAVDASVTDEVSTSDGASMRDMTATGDSAVCSPGPATAQVDGTTVSFAVCEAYEVGSPGQYVYLEMDCTSPTLLVRVENTGRVSVQYTATDSGVRYMGGPAVTIASLGAVGGFVDATVSAPTLQAQTSTAQTISFQGSFHVCRTRDLPWGGH